MTPNSSIELTQAIFGWLAAAPVKAVCGLAHRRISPGNVKPFVVWGPKFVEQNKIIIESPDSDRIDLQAISR
jgi:hypothetical protein